MDKRKTDKDHTQRSAYLCVKVCMYAHIHNTLSEPGCTRQSWTIFSSKERVRNSHHSAWSQELTAPCVHPQVRFRLPLKPPTATVKTHSVVHVYSCLTKLRFWKRKSSQGWRIVLPGLNPHSKNTHLMWHSAVLNVSCRCYCFLATLAARLWGWQCHLPWILVQMFMVPRWWIQMMTVTTATVGRIAIVAPVQAG